jgi:hypothetical protein
MTRDEWMDKIIGELRGLIAHYDGLDVPTAAQLAGIVQGGCRALTSQPGFSTHDALKLAASLVQLIREAHLEEARKPKA